jgi:DnaJ-domain-containing protein 1
MVKTFCCAVAFACMALPATAVQDETTASPATSLESMLVGHVCGQPKSSSPGDEDARERCVGDQLHALRVVFGYDLRRLSAVERRRLDTSCSRFRSNYTDVELYLNCLTQGLGSLRAEWAPGQSTASAVGPQTVAATADAQTMPNRRGSAAIVSVLAGGAGLALACGLVFVARKRWPRGRVCRDCGTAMQGASDLCPDCRHRAAVALRQATADRAEQERSEQEAQRRQHEEAEERQRQILEQRARLQQQEEEQRRAELARRAAEAQRPVAMASSQPEDDDLPEVFDPYAVLSVSPEASLEEIEAAYRKERSRHDENLVAHLGDAVRMHFKMKADAVEEAYRALTGSIPA